MCLHEIIAPVRVLGQVHAQLPQQELLHLMLLLLLVHLLLLLLLILPLLLRPAPPLLDTLAGLDPQAGDLLGQAVQLVQDRGGGGGAGGGEGASGEGGGPASAGIYQHELEQEQGWNWSKSLTGQLVVFRQITIN